MNANTMSTITENGNIGSLGLVYPVGNSEIQFPVVPESVVPNSDEVDVGVNHTGVDILCAQNYLQTSATKTPHGDRTIGNGSKFNSVIHAGQTEPTTSPEPYADDGIEIQNTSQPFAIGAIDMSVSMLKTNDKNPSLVNFNLQNNSEENERSAISEMTDLAKFPQLKGYRIRNSDKLFLYLEKNSDLINVFSDILPKIKKIINPDKVCLEYCRNYLDGKETIFVYIFKYGSDEPYFHSLQHKIYARIYEPLDNKTKRKINPIIRGFTPKSFVILPPRMRSWG